jgi:hypothetical protein
MLSFHQVVRTIVLGVLFWFAAAMIIRYQGSLLTEGETRALMFVLAFPLAWTFMYVLKALAGLRTGQVVAAVSLCTAAAAFCDGIALGWFPELYGNYAKEGGALILWGAAAGLAISFYGDRGAKQGDGHPATARASAPAESPRSHSRRWKPARLPEPQA